MSVYELTVHLDLPSRKTAAQRIVEDAAENAKGTPTHLTL